MAIKNPGENRGYKIIHKRISVLAKNGRNQISDPKNWAGRPNNVDSINVSGAMAPKQPPEKPLNPY